MTDHVEIIARALYKPRAIDDDLGPHPWDFKAATTILSALDAAGMVIVPKGLIVEERSRAIREFCAAVKILGSDEAMGLPDDVRIYRADSAFRAKIAASESGGE